jgi:hypothetical protein
MLAALDNPGSVIGCGCASVYPITAVVPNNALPADRHMVRFDENIPNEVSQSTEGHWMLCESGSDGDAVSVWYQYSVWRLWIRIL